jgi:hypothetical protein
MQKQAVDEQAERIQNQGGAE